MDQFKTFFLVLTLSASTLTLHGQSPIRVQIQVSKPYPNKINDFQSNPNQMVILLTNNSQTTYNVQLLGSINGDNNVSVRTSANYRSGRPIVVAPLTLTRVSADEVGALFDPNTLVFAGIQKDNAIRMNGLPEGVYQICARVIDYNTRAPLSEDEPLGCSNIFMVSNLEPPVIIKPFADDSLKAQVPQNIVFSWSLPPGAPPSTQYTVRLVEIPDANRNPFDVMRSSRQSYFETVIIGAPTMLYGPAEPPLVAGRRYALMITASDPFDNLVFRNGGRSEVVAFTYGRPERPSSITDHFSKGDSSFPNLPRTVITGKINWYYQASEEKGSSLSSSVKLLDLEHFSVKEAMLDPSAVTQNSSHLQQAMKGVDVSLTNLSTTAIPKQAVVSAPRSFITNTQAPGVAIYGAGTVTGISAAELSPAIKYLDRIPVISKRGNTPYPLQQVSVKVYAIQVSGKESLLASTITDDEGVFEAAFINTAFYNPTLGDKIKVYVNHPDFLLQQAVLTLSNPDSTGRYDLGTLTALARTYRFKPKVLDEEGLPVSNAVVELYRPISFYDREPNMKHEGSPRSDSTFTVNGQVCKKIASIRSGQTGYKLFYRDSWTDHYVIKVVHETLNPIITTLGTAADGSAREEILLVEKDYKGTTRMPSLKGKVVKRLKPEIEVRGAIVTLYFNDDAKFGPKEKTTVENVGKKYFIGSTYKNDAVQQNVAQSVKPNPLSAQGTFAKTVIGNNNLLAPIQATPSTTGNSYTAAPFIGSTATSFSAAALLGNSMSTTTDSSGNFLFTDLPISPTETRMTVRIPGYEKVFEFKVLINAKGMNIDQGKVYLDMTVFTLGGVVKNEQGQPISRPVVRWVSGGDPKEGDEYGRFIIENTAGKDTLVVSKLGFEEKRIPITLAEPVTSGKSDKKGKSTTAIDIISPAMWGEQVQALPSFAATSVSAPAFSAAGLGYYTVHTVNTGVLQLSTQTITSDTNKKDKGNSTSLATIDTKFALSPLYSSFITPEQQPVPPVDLGTIVLRKKIGRLMVKVKKESDDTKVSSAQINIIDTPVSGSTSPEGSWYSEVPGGDIIVEVKGAAGSGLVTLRKQVATSDVDTTVVEVALKNGVTVNGIVTAGSQSISDANIRVDGLDYINVKTNSTGRYSIIIPVGEYTLKATKAGYVGAEKQQNFLGSVAEVNFNLAQAGFDISKLLGFDIEVEKMEGTGTTRTLSGAVVNISSNAMFTVKPDTRLPFDNIVVDLVGGVPVPRSGQINLSITNLDLLAFGYLPVKLKNNDLALAIKQVAGNNRAGRLEGIPEINYQKFIPIPTGFKVAESIKHALTTAGVTGVIPVLAAGEGLPVAESFSISASAGNVELYGFNVELNSASCQVKNDGLYLKGDLSLSGVPLLDKSKLGINELVIGKDASLTRVSLNVAADQSINFAGWKASLLSVGINENGLKLSGNVKVKIPESSESGIGFDNLTVSKTALYGGDFTLPEEGIDVFGIVKMKRGIKPLSFGRIGNTTVHYIGGSGEFKLPRFIDKTLAVEFFQIQTDGKFEARVPVNMNIPLLGLASLSIRSLGFRTIGGVGVDVMGDFNLHAIPFFKASAGGIHYGKSGAVSVDELGVGFDLVGIATLNAKAKFVDQPGRQGFEGSGSIKIKATPLDLGLGFRYYKLPGGIEIGALLRAGVIIPIGAVTLAEIEGEFGLNTQDDKWMGRIGGSLSIGGLNAALAIKPLSITVENGPVFKLDGGLAVLGQNVAKAHGILDFPKSYFSFNFKQNLNFLPELYTMDGGGIFVVSTAKDNTYWMMGVMYRASMLGGLVKANANITAGWGLNVDAHPEHGEYTNFLNRDYLDNGVLKGIHVATYAGIDFDTGERGFAGVASGRAWYNNHGAVNMDMGFGRGRYGFRVAAGWEAGAYLKIADVNIAGAEVGIEGELKGFYDYSASYLQFDGYLRAKLIAWIGDCSNDCVNKICWGGCFDPCSITPFDACEICPIPVGGKICLKPGVNASFNSNSGFSMGIDF